MQNTDYQTLISALKNTNAETIELVTRTPVKMNKKKNPYYERRVERVTEGEYKFGSSYTALMNESIDTSTGASEYKTSKLPWGQWLEGAENKIIVYTKTDEEGNETTSYYLRYYNAVNKLVGMKYLIDDVEATKFEIDTIHSFEPKKKAVPKTQSEHGLTESNRVMVQLVNFDNIQKIVVDGVVFD